MSPIARCSICKRVLTDPYSIAVMMGPECRGAFKHSGGKLPKPKWTVSHGRVIYTGLAEKQEPPAVNTTETVIETPTERGQAEKKCQSLE
jgi:hypothetical protein